MLRGMFYSLRHRGDVYEVRGRRGAQPGTLRMASFLSQQDRRPARHGPGVYSLVQRSGPALRRAFGLGLAGAGVWVVIESARALALF